MSLPGSALASFSRSASVLGLQPAGRRDHQRRLDDERDRHDVGRRIVRQLVEHRRRDRERIAGRAEKRVVVPGRNERGRRRNAVAAGAVLDHHALAPALRQPVGEQAQGDVDAGAGRLRRDDLDRTLRPALGCRRHGQQRQRRRKSEETSRQVQPTHFNATQVNVMHDFRSQPPRSIVLRSIGGYSAAFNGVAVIAGSVVAEHDAPPSTQNFAQCG